MASREPSKKNPLERMKANTRKAFSEAKKLNYKNESLISNIEIFEKDWKIDFDIQQCESIGRREVMEDAKSVEVLPNGGLLVTICDGHGDRGEISRYCTQRFHQLFYPKFYENQDNIPLYFEKIMKSVQEELEILKLAGGSTALICYIDPNTHMGYFTNLGDSEAKLFTGKELLPLTCVRNWACPKDELRGRRVIEKIKDRASKAHFLELWSSKHPKERRIGPRELNVSRSMGDLDSCFLEGEEGVIQKPKVSIFPVRACYNGQEEGQLLIFGCDGLWDFVSEDELIENVLLPFGEDNRQDLAKRIVNYALEQGRSSDNVSVIVVRIKRKVDESEFLYQPSSFH